MVIEILHDEEGHRRLFEGFLREYEAEAASARARVDLFDSLRNPLATDLVSRFRTRQAPRRGHSPQTARRAQFWLA